MDQATKRMLADLGQETRTAIVNSVSQRDLQDAQSRSLKPRKVRADPALKSKLNMWKDFHAQEANEQAAYITQPLAASTTTSSVAQNIPGPAVTSAATSNIAVTTSAVRVAQKPDKSAAPPEPTTAADEPIITKLPKASVTSTKQGKVSGTYTDGDGNSAMYVKKFRMPVEATITLTSKSSYIGVSELAAMMETLAIAMGTMRYQCMPGVYDDGTGLYEMEDLLTRLGRTEEEHKGLGKK